MSALDDAVQQYRSGKHKDAKAELAALRATVEAQARKLEDAESVLIAIRPHLPIFGDEYNSIHPSRKLIDDWFAANPPASQTQKVTTDEPLAKSA